MINFYMIKNLLIILKRNKHFLFLFSGLVVIAFNIFLLPFFAWTTGIVRTWLILNGYVPFRDFTWLRAPFDLFLLSFWFRIFGPSANSYQLFIFLILCLIAIAIFAISYRFLPKLKFLPFLFFIVFLFPIFQNTEMGELLVGLWNLLMLGSILLYLNAKKRKFLLIAGLLAGVSLITKQNSIGVIFAVLITVIVDHHIRKLSLKVRIKDIGILVAGVLFPPIVLLVYYWVQGSLMIFLNYSVGMVLGGYRRVPLPPGFSLGDGMWIEFGYFFLLIPVLIFRKQTKLNIQQILFLVLMLICLIPSLFPSFLSYRAFPSFPIVSIIAGYSILIFFTNKPKDKNLIFRKTFILLCFLAFILVNLRYINPYISQFSSEKIKFNNFIKDYSEDEINVAKWLKNNTGPHEKITSYTSDMVYFLSNRFPQNKFIDPVPVMLLYSDSSDIFFANPPRIFILDDMTVKDFPDLAKWKFYKFVQKEYTAVEHYGTLTIYEYKKIRKSDN